MPHIDPTSVAMYNTSVSVYPDRVYRSPEGGVRPEDTLRQSWHVGVVRRWRDYSRGRFVGHLKSDGQEEHHVVRAYVEAFNHDVASLAYREERVCHPETVLVCREQRTPVRNHPANK